MKRVEIYKKGPYWWQTSIWEPFILLAKRRLQRTTRVQTPWRGYCTHIWTLTYILIEFSKLTSFSFFLIPTSTYCPASSRGANPIRNEKEAGTKSTCLPVISLFGYREQRRSGGWRVGSTTLISSAFTALLKVGRQIEGSWLRLEISVHSHFCIFIAWSKQLYHHHRALGQKSSRVNCCPSSL